MNRTRLGVAERPALGITTKAGIYLHVAPRRLRLAGQMIDASIASLPMIVLGVLARFTGLGATPAMLGTAATFLYLMFADGFSDGQSLAKRLLGMRVVDADTGAPCTFGESFTRNITTLFGPIDWIFIFGERRQRLGDKLVGTIVVTAD